MLGLNLIHVSKRHHRCPSTWQCLAISKCTADGMESHVGTSPWISRIQNILLIRNNSKWQLRSCHIIQHSLISTFCRIYASGNWAIIGSCNGLSPVRCQAITWTNADLLSIGLLGTNFSESWIRILSFSFKKKHLKMLSATMTAILSRGDELNHSNT